MLKGAGRKMTAIVKTFLWEKESNVAPFAVFFIPVVVWSCFIDAIISLILLLRDLRMLQVRLPAVLERLQVQALVSLAGLH